MKTNQVIQKSGLGLFIPSVSAGDGICLECISEASMVASLLIHGENGTWSIRTEVKRDPDCDRMGYYIMPNLHTAIYVRPGPVPTLWHSISPGTGTGPVPT